MRISDGLRSIHKIKCSAIIVAAGESVRMGRDKLFLNLCGIPVLARTLLAVDGCDSVNEIILVVRPDILEKSAELCREYGIKKVNKIVLGGKTRTESVLAGSSEIRSDSKIILVHDGDRPLVSSELIEDAVHVAVLHKSATSSTKVTDTIKQDAGGYSQNTLKRDMLVSVQTPQAFVSDVLKIALSSAVRSGTSFTDDCSAAEAIGVKTYFSKGSKDNIKITYPSDMYIAEAIIRSRNNESSDRSGV